MEKVKEFVGIKFLTFLIIKSFTHSFDTIMSYMKVKLVRCYPVVMLSRYQNDSLKSICLTEVDKFLKN